MFSKKHAEKGDTIVEVLLALTIVSAVAVGAIALMTRSMNTAINALERSQVRSGLVEQAELLQYIRDSYARADADKGEYPANLWTTIRARSVTTPQSDPCNPGPRAFYLNAGNINSISVANYGGASNQPDTYAKPGQGMWIEAQFINSSVDYVDFYIKSCWSPVGSGIQQQSSTVVRLYDVN